MTVSIAWASSITDAEGIQKILDAKDLTGGKGFRIFNYDGRLTLEV